MAQVLNREFKVPQSKDVGYDDNPYSRLAALEAMGVVPDFARIRDRTAVVIGVGGVGTVVADCLVRTGIGRIHIFDPDIVTPANMNRLFFTPSQISMKKVDAAAVTLRSINPETVVIPHAVDVTTPDGYRALQSALSDNVSPATRPCAPATLGAGTPGESVVAISCVDNYSARTTINAAALSVGAVWIECGVAEDATRGHVQTFAPGTGPCYECSAAVAASEGREPRRRGVCAASLPMTMGAVGCFGAMRALKLALGFGAVVAGDYFQWSAVEDWATSMACKANPHCVNVACGAAQRAAVAEATAAAVAVADSGRGTTAGGGLGGGSDGGESGDGGRGDGGGDHHGWAADADAADAALGFSVVDEHAPRDGARGGGAGGSSGASGDAGGGIPPRGGSNVAHGGASGRTSAESSSTFPLSQAPASAALICERVESVGIDVLRDELAALML